MPVEACGHKSWGREKKWHEKKKWCHGEGGHEWGGKKDHGWGCEKPSWDEHYRW